MARIKKAQGSNAAPGNSSSIKSQRKSQPKRLPRLGSLISNSAKAPTSEKNLPSESPRSNLSSTKFSDLKNLSVASLSHPTSQAYSAFEASMKNSATMSFRENDSMTRGKEEQTLLAALGSNPTSEFDDDFFNISSARTPQASEDIFNIRPDGTVNPLHLDNNFNSNCEAPVGNSPPGPSDNHLNGVDHKNSRILSENMDCAYGTDINHANPIGSNNYNGTNSWLDDCLVLQDSPLQQQRSGSSASTTPNQGLGFHSGTDALVPTSSYLNLRHSDSIPTPLPNSTDNGLEPLAAKPMQLQPIDQNANELEGLKQILISLTKKVSGVIDSRQPNASNIGGHVTQIDTRVRCLEGQVAQVAQVPQLRQDSVSIQEQLKNQERAVREIKENQNKLLGWLQQESERNGQNEIQFENALYERDNTIRGALMGFKEDLAKLKDEVTSQQQELLSIKRSLMPRRSYI